MISNTRLGLARNYAALLFAIAALHCSSAFAVSVIDRVSSGANAAAILPTVNAYRSDLGLLNANGACIGTCTPGIGRREINWDGVGDSFASPNRLPGDFFNQPDGASSARVRGIGLSSSGTFEVSASAASGNPILFDNHIQGFSIHFAAFSGERIFGLVGTNVLEVRFSLPGQPNASALVSGFGAVFTDVEHDNVVHLEYFGANNSLMHELYAPGYDPAGTQDTQKAFSFAGASFSTPVISMVRVTVGQCDLNLLPNPSHCDAVAMDDFIFGEPAAVPEISSSAMYLSGLVTLGILATRRRRS